ncbi:hypothetical protein Plhal304r1_c008g0033371 [Plasmopara halstedii]
MRERYTTCRSFPNTERGCRMGRLALMHHSCVVIRTEKASMTSHCSLGRGHGRVTQYLAPGIRSI